jgi:hypothetical protein
MKLNNSWTFLVGLYSKVGLSSRISSSYSCQLSVKILVFPHCRQLTYDMMSNIFVSQ